MISEVPGPLPQSARERRLAEARANDALVLQSLAPAGDAGLRGTELAARTGLPERTVRAVVTRLTARRLVVRDGQRGPVRATIAGRTEVGMGTPGVALGAALEAAIDYFPAEAQRAFLRLLLSGIVARHHLAGDHPDGWGGFICLGPTKSGKTSLARLVCQAFGIPSWGVFTLNHQTPGAILGRRRQTADGWAFSPSELIGLPFVCMDEFARADPSLRTEASHLLLGQAVVHLEGQAVGVSPLVMVALNAPPTGLGAVLDDAFVRRSIVLDTGELGGLLEDVDEAMRQLSTTGVIPLLDLGRLKPPSALPEEERRKLRDALRSGLTGEGWRLVDVEAVSRLALGRVPLMGDGASTEQACLVTALDYLIVTSTVPGHVRPGAVSELAGRLRGEAPLGADVERHLSQQTTLVRLKQDQRVTKLAADLAFEADRERLRSELLQVADLLGRKRDPGASAEKVTLRKAAEKARGCRSREALEDIRAAAQPHREQAQAILRTRETEAQRVEQGKREEADRRREATQARGQQARQRTQAHREAKAQRRAWVPVLRALYHIPPYESPGAALGALVKAGWLESEDAPQPVGKGLDGFLERLSASPFRYVVKQAEVPGWPMGRVVGESQAADFWAAACDLAEGLADRSQLRQRPLWRSRWDVQQAREDARDLRRLGL